MQSNLSQSDQDVGPVVITRAIPHEQTYTCLEGVHHKLQDWEEKVRTIARYDLLIAITEGVLLSVLMRQADAPHANNFQKLMAIWLIIHRTAITTLFQTQMRKLETSGSKNFNQKIPDSNYLSVFTEGAAIVTAIAFQQSIRAFNKGSMMAYTIFPIMGIEFLSICFRILSRIVLSNQIEGIATAYKSAKNTK